MRKLTVLFIGLIIALQWPLWFGKNSAFRVWQLKSQQAEQLADLQSLQMRNNALLAEVRDLKTGTDALEERSRFELGMIKKGEVFFQVLGDSSLLKLPMVPNK